MACFQALHMRHGRLGKFCRCENGSFTLETVIWMPIFAILLAIVVNLSMVFYFESQMLRVSQDATRAFSLGRFSATENQTEAQLAEQYIIDNLSFIDADLDVSVQNVGSIAQTVVSTNAAALMPFSLMSSPFEGVPIGVSTQYIIEY